MRHRAITGATLIVATVLVSFSTGADLVLIDDFGDGQMLSVQSAGGGGVVAGGNQVLAGGALGGEREFLIELAGSVPAGNGAILAANAHGSSLLNLNTDASTEATVTIIWDGVDSDMGLDAIGLRGGGPTGVDLSGGGMNSTITLGVVFDDLPIRLTFTAWTDAEHSSQGTLVLPGLILGPTAVFELEFSKFTVLGAAGGADFSNIGALALTFDVTGLSAGTDLRVDFIGTGVVLPNPIALQAGLVGLTAVALSRRRVPWRRTRRRTAARYAPPGRAMCVAQTTSDS